jgi:hypothetical protein
MNLNIKNPPPCLKVLVDTIVELVAPFLLLGQGRFQSGLFTAQHAKLLLLLRGCRVLRGCASCLGPLFLHLSRIEMKIFSVHPTSKAVFRIRIL